VYIGAGDVHTAIKLGKLAPCIVQYDLKIQSLKNNFYEVRRWKI